MSCHEERTLFLLLLQLPLLSPLFRAFNVPSDPLVSCSDLLAEFFLIPRYLLLWIVDFPVLVVACAEHRLAVVG